MQLHIEVQHRTISNLKVELDRLKEEKQHIEKLLVNQNPELSLGPSLETDDEESICRMQLRLLKNVSMSRELTLEEAKRVEIYTKILNNKLNQPKTVVVKTKSISNEDLLAAFETIKESDDGTKT